MTSDPDQIRGSIERTQQNLRDDVDALTEKVSPPRIVERRVQRTRYAMTNLKDKIMGSAAEQTSAIGGAASSSAGAAKDTLTETAGTAKDTLTGAVSSAADVASSVPEQARRRARGNPLAAGLIAFGAGWLASSLLPATEPEQQAASQVKDLATEKGRPVVQRLGQAGQEAAQELRESAQERVQSVRQTAADAASTVTDEARSQATDISDHAQAARSRVTEHADPGGN